ncbi:MAG: DNA (cytosine-5-)-methyltransferase, partial [Phascolarctobacterium sp.]|nr:DNA (cytosine-5-)-methyltransferase [Phascolarctobacterium sp.]
MNFIDLCAGIGGIRLGLEQAGHKCVGFCEFDKFALQSYKAIHNTEGEAEFHDITKVTDDQIRELAESRRIDIIAGGFPCQAFSVAGKRQGFDDTRGTIFFEIARFIKIIKPRYFICENVKGLFSHDSGRTFRTILGAMAELGYCVEWQILNSKDYGVPQNRERIFIIGHLGNGSGRKVFPIFGTYGENTCELQDKRKTVRLGNILDDIEKARHTQALTGIICEKNSTKETDQACTLDANYFKGITNNQARTGVLVAPVLTPDREEKRQNGRRMKEPGEPAFCLNTQDRHGVAIFENIEEPKIIDAIYNNCSPRVTDECLTLRSERQGLLVKEATKQGYAEAFEGDSVNLEQPNSETRRGRVGKQIANTLLCNGQMGVVAPGVRIRKLTPRECWRLQGFPDEYFDRAKAAGVSDSQLYKQAGNAVTVNVAAVIGRKLAEISAESCAVESEQNHIGASPSP